MLPSWNKATWDLVFLSPKDTTPATEPAATQFGYAELGMMCSYQCWFTALDSYELKSTGHLFYRQQCLDLFITLNDKNGGNKDEQDGGVWWGKCGWVQNECHRWLKERNQKVLKSLIFIAFMFAPTN